MEAIRLKARRFDRKILFRDWLETVVAVLVVVVFASTMPFVGWMARAGLAIVIAACFYIAWRLHATRRRYGAPGPDQPLADRLRFELCKLDDQVVLLRSVHWWYLGPLGVGVIIAYLGMKGWTMDSLWFVLGVIALYAAIYWLNQRTVRRYLMPRRRELVRLLGTLEHGREDNGGGNEDA